MSVLGFKEQLVAVSFPAGCIALQFLAVVLRLGELLRVNVTGFQPARGGYHGSRWGEQVRASIPSDIRSSAKAIRGKVGPPEPPPVNRTLTGFLLITIDSYGIPYLISNIDLYYYSAP